MGESTRMEFILSFINDDVVALVPKVEDHHDFLNALSSLVYGAMLDAEDNFEDAKEKIIQTEDELRQVNNSQLTQKVEALANKIKELPAEQDSAQALLDENNVDPAQTGAKNSVSVMRDMLGTEAAGRHGKHKEGELEGGLWSSAHCL